MSLSNLAASCLISAADGINKCQQQKESAPYFTEYVKALQYESVADRRGRLIGGFGEIGIAAVGL